MLNQPITVTVVDTRNGMREHPVTLPASILNGRGYGATFIVDDALKATGVELTYKRDGVRIVRVPKQTGVPIPKARPMDLLNQGLQARLEDQDRIVV